ncbi:hypothetical protein KCM76_24860 [Zooshikella marina]|uniref:hypothetical protein n=1 Tax=Zooshikella ganghwensis TaxID=202772 RepID=UPI001BAE5DE0|nr:hypothetical protein [Zooshikella ganghwensis]MBU2709250.1 hypothetical protein [Zooshikella ganghwensis]
MITEYESTLKEIRLKRKEAYQLDFPILLCLALGLVSSLVLPAFAPFFGLAAFVAFYRKLVKAARILCPRCNEPFGTNSNIVLGFGTGNCQQCGLALYKNKS